MKAAYISALCLATAASFYGTAKLTNETVEQNEGQLVELRAKLAESEVASDQQISALTSEMQDERARLGADFQTKLGEQAAKLKESEEQIASLERSVTAEQSKLQATLAQKLKFEAEAAESWEEARALQGQIAELQLAAEKNTPEVQTGNAIFESEIKQLETENLSLKQRLEELDIADKDADSDLSSLEAVLAERDAQISKLEAMNLDTTAQLAEASAAVAAMEKDYDETAGLLVEELARVQELNVSQNDYKTKLAELTDVLAKQEMDNEELMAALAVQSSEPRAIPEPSDSDDENVKALRAKLTELTEFSQVQDATIQTLRLGIQQEKMSSSELAEVCLTRAAKIFETGQIEFSSGTTTIFSGSEATLRELRDLAIGCQHNDLYVEVGGHTDSQGAEESNQALSEARAAAVVDFLGNLGVASTTMRPVGYGETKPIETNDTRVGRAANRRITFEWKPRTLEATASRS